MQKSELCPKSKIRTPERHHWRRSSDLIVNFGHISHDVESFNCWLWTYTSLLDRVSSSILLTIIFQQTFTCSELVIETIEKATTKVKTLTKTQKRSYSHLSSVITINIFPAFSGVSIVNFEHVFIFWVYIY